MNVRRITVLVAGLTSVLGARAASGQASTKSHTNGFFLGVGLEGASQTVEGEDMESGGGLGLNLGYGFNKTFALYANLGGASISSHDIGDYALAHVDLGARVSFRSGPNQVVPYLIGAVTGRAAKIDFVGLSGHSNSANVSGAGFTLGVGLNVFFNRTLALDLNYLYTGGNYDQVKVDNVTISGLDLSAKTGRLHAGVTWFVGK